MVPRRVVGVRTAAFAMLVAFLGGQVARAQDSSGSECPTGTLEVESGRLGSTIAALLQAAEWLPRDPCAEIAGPPSPAALRQARKYLEPGPVGGGAKPRLTTIPIVFSDRRGARLLVLYRMQSADGSVRFVEPGGRTYSDLEDWKRNNRLPPGDVSFPENGDVPGTRCDPVWTSSPTPSTRVSARFVRGLDVATGAAGVTLLASSLVIGTAGTGGALIAAAGLGTGLYGGIRAGFDLLDRVRHEESLNPFSSAEARSNELALAASIVGLGATAASVRGSVAVAKGLNAVGIVLAGAGTADFGLQTFQQWEHLSRAERTAALARLALSGTTTAISIRNAWTTGTSATVRRAAGGAVEPPPLPEYLEKLERAAKPLTPREGGAFLSGPAGGVEGSSMSKQLRSVGPHLRAHDLSLEAAATSPQLLKIGSARGFQRGGLAVWKNDVFPVDYFVRRHAEGARAEIGKREPWFRWDASRSEFEFRDSGSNARLLELVRNGRKSPEKIALYRGTTAYEALLLELGRDATGAARDASWREALRSTLREIVDYKKSTLAAYVELAREGMVTETDARTRQAKYDAVVRLAEDRISTAERARTADQIRAFARDSLDRLLADGSFGGGFVTPDPDRAAMFAKGRVVRFDVPFEELDRLLRSDRLYVGLEAIDQQPAVEIGFLPPADGAGGERLGDLLLRSFSTSTAAGSSQLFN